MVIATWDHGVPASRKALEVLAAGGNRLDAVCDGIGVSEDDPTETSVGLGGLPNAEGVVQLDACIMDGPAGRGGAVGCLERIKNPIRVARRVMEDTPHVFLVGADALRFAREKGFAEMELLTPESRRRWEEWKARAASADATHREHEKAPASRARGDHDTIAMVVLDRDGHVAGGCSTSGLAWKLPGRVGDSPILGGGLFVDEDVGGAGSTGVGEEVMQICGTHTVVELMRAGRTPDEACRAACERILAKHPDARTKQVAFMALRKDGAIGAWSIKHGFQYAIGHAGDVTFIDAPSIIPRGEGA